jgi:hypothetical protein
MKGERDHWRAMAERLCRGGGPGARQHEGDKPARRDSAGSKIALCDRRNGASAAGRRGARTAAWLCRKTIRGALPMFGDDGVAGWTCYDGFRST